MRARRLGDLLEQVEVLPPERHREGGGRVGLRRDDRAVDRVGGAADERRREQLDEQPGIDVEPLRHRDRLAERLVRRRRRFTDEEKRHFLELASQPGSSFSDVAERYGLALSLLFRWRKEFGEGPAPFAGFASVTVADDGATPTPITALDLDGLRPMPPPQEQSGGMEIALKDGKRVRVEAGADPEAVRRLVSLLEGAS